MARAYIALGSNLGDRAANLAIGCRFLAGVRELAIAGATAVLETQPLGGIVQPPYLNQMLAVDTTLTPNALLATCQAAERSAGRERDTRWCSRTLDLDLVRYGDLMCDLPDLILPHPGLRDRSFWATELAELESHG